MLFASHFILNRFLSFSLQLIFIYLETSHLKELSVSVSLLQAYMFKPLLFWSQFTKQFQLLSFFSPFVMSKVVVGFSCVQMVSQNTTVKFYWPQESKIIQTFNQYPVVSQQASQNTCFPRGFLPSVPNWLLLSDVFFFVFFCQGTRKISHHNLPIYTPDM